MTYNSRDVPRKTISEGRNAKHKTPCALCNKTASEVNQILHQTESDLSSSKGYAQALQVCNDTLTLARSAVNQKLRRKKSWTRAVLLAVTC